MTWAIILRRSSGANTPAGTFLRAPQPWIWCNDSIGESDAIDGSEVKTWLRDGLPNTLAQWIDADGLTHFKVKLGITLETDITRFLHIDRVVTETETRRGIHEWHYSLDFNEQCPNADYMIEFLRRVKESSPAGYDRITYIEQPESRDLVATPAQLLCKVSKLKPVTIDEALTGYTSFCGAGRLATRAWRSRHARVRASACSSMLPHRIWNAAHAERSGSSTVPRHLSGAPVPRVAESARR